MCVEYFESKRCVVKGVFYDDFPKKKDVIDLLGESYQQDLSEHGVIHFKNSKGMVNIVMFGEYVFSHPALGVAVMSACLFETIYRHSPRHLEVVV